MPEPSSAGDAVRAGDMGQGFYISRTLAAVAGVLAAGAAATIIALAVVLAQERASQPSDNGAGGPNTPAPGGPTTPAPGVPTTPAPGVPTTPAPGVPTTPAQPPQPWQRLRLPTDLVPLHYEVSLWPHLEPEPGTKDFYIFNGSSSVLFKCDNTTDLILIHCDRLNLSSASGQLAWVRDTNGKQLAVKKSWVQEDTQYLVIVLTEKLKTGANYSVYTEFTGQLDDDLRGFYRSQYTDENGNTRIIATTQMQPTDARKAFPCFDEPAMKATFSISLMHDENHVALSNMPMMANKSMIINNVRWYNTTFKTTPKMSTYLLAFIVCDFDKVENTSNGIMIRIWARKAAIAEGQSSYALNVTGPILTYFASYYNVSYPLPKSDQIALPDFNAGAMENWGLVTYRETALLYDPLKSSNSNKERVVTVIAHELAHQWFGNLVTLKWWNDLWLNEGFASYVEYLGADFAEPSWNLTLLTVLNDVYRVMAVDALASSHPLSSKEGEINTPAEINELFDAISYSKGGAVLRMLSNFLTEPVFLTGLQKYLIKYSYGNTVYSDLFDQLQQAANGKVQLPKTVNEIMNRWTLQMGFPVITINTADGRIKQQHFLLDPNSNVTRPSEFNYVWIVPIQWMKKDSNTNLTWLMEKEDTKPEMKSTGTEWVLANIDVVGYYRVNYDDRNWENLVKQLTTNHEVIRVLNRAQIIDDAFNLARAEYRKTTSALETTKYLKNEREYIPWEAALNNLAYLKVMLDRSDAFGNMQKYMLQQVTPLYQYFKMITQNWTKPSEGHMDQYNEINAMSVACSYGHEECQKTADEFFRNWMNSGNNKIPLNLKSAVYCSAIASGGQEEWDFAWDKYKSASIATEAEKLRLALACTKQPWLLNRYLQYSLDPDMVRKQDATSTISAIARNVIGQPLTWDFIRANWATIFQQYGGGSFSFSGLISSVTERFSTEFELKQEEIFTPVVKPTDNDFLSTVRPIPDLEQFKTDNEHIGFGSGTRAIEQALEKTKANIKWVNANKDSVSQWFFNATTHP